GVHPGRERLGRRLGLARTGPLRRALAPRRCRGLGARRRAVGPPGWAAGPDRGRSGVHLADQAVARRAGPPAGRGPHTPADGLGRGRALPAVRSRLLTLGARESRLAPHIVQPPYVITVGAPGARGTDGDATPEPLGDAARQRAGLHGEAACGR